MRRVLITLAALAGFAVFAYVQPRATRHPGGEFFLSPEQYHQKAVAAVRDILGIDASKMEWAAGQRQQTRHILYLWQAKYARTPIDFLHSGKDLDIVFTDKGGSVLMVGISSAGRVTSVRRVYNRRKRNASSPSQIDKEPIARKAFSALAGEFAPQFTGPQVKGEDEFQWTAPASDARLKWEIVVKLDSAAVSEASIRPQPDEALQKEFRSALMGMGDQQKILGVVLAFAGTPLLIGMLIFGWMRKQVDRKAAITAGALLVIPSLIPTTYGAGGMGRNVGIASFFGTIMLGVLVMALIGVGQRAAREQEWPRWTGLRLLLHRQWKARLIGEQVMAGLLWAGWIAAVPALVTISGLFPGTYLSGLDAVTTQFVRMPALTALLQPTGVFSIAMFATLLPVISQRVPTRFLSLAVFWPCAAFVFYVFLPFVAGPIANATAATVMSGLAILLYLRYGVLAVIAGGRALLLLWTASTEFATGVADLQTAAWTIVIAYGVFLAGSAVWAQKGTEAEPHDPLAEQFLSQREKLKAEFSLAQQAQQRMLPDEPPSLSGFSVAASCQPARDVGGDLYDYFELPDGRTGFCVADVSGKGMPAALYMTLTKGLIAAAAPEARDVTDLASTLNRHLHVACKHKMFVTAVLATLDEKSRTVELVRAGHNPALLFEAASRRARYVNPAGIGLGLTGPVLFDRGTKPGSLMLTPGDTLILYSDGVTEAMNEHLELFGEERLKQSLERCAQGNAPYILTEIKKDLALFSGSEPAHDDVTLMVLQAQ